MKFCLVDSILEQSPQRIVTCKHVTLAEEYLADHFPTFPVLPGVMMIEAMVQAARQLLSPLASGNARLVLGDMRAVKFSNLVRPGERLIVDVSLVKDNGDGTYSCKGNGRVVRHEGDKDQPTEAAAVSGRFTMRPMRL